MYGVADLGIGPALNQRILHGRPHRFPSNCCQRYYDDYGTKSNQKPSNGRRHSARRKQRRRRRNGGEQESDCPDWNAKNIP